MAKDYGDGVWRTINGRRVFIAEGQSLGDAMKKSGKFGKVSKVKGVRKNTFKDEISQGDKNRFAMGQGLSKDAVKGYAKARQDENEENQKRLLDLEMHKYTSKEKLERAKEKLESGKLTDFEKKYYENYIEKREGKSIGKMLEERKNRESSKNSYTRDELKSKYGTDNVDLINAGKEKENRVSLSEKQVKEGNRLNEKSKSMAKEDIQTYLGGNKSNWDNDGDFIRDLADNYNLDLDDAKKMFNEAHNEKKYGKDALPTNKEKTSNWQEQVKANNEKMEKDVADIQKKINEYRSRSANAKDGLESYQLLKEADRLQNEYYERFRENERANAKIKSEANINPNDKYVNVEAYATYKDKFKDAFGEGGSGDNYVSAKMYTNDEFMEHLEDSNWHSERKALLDANLTNQELAYIKDHTKVGAWSVGEELTGKANVEKMIQEAKSKASSKSMNDTIREKASKKQTWKPATTDEEIRNRYSEDMAYARGTIPHGSSDERLLRTFKRVDKIRAGHQQAGEEVWDWRNGQRVDDARNLPEDKESTNKIFNDAVRNRKVMKAYQNYIKKHPNSQLKLNEFKDLYQG